MWKVVEESDTLRKDEISMKKGNVYALGKEKGQVQREIARFAVQDTLRPRERDKTTETES